MSASEKVTCGSPWPGGLKHGILTECDRLRPPHSPHTGKHGNKDAKIEWWGGDPLDEAELAIAERLRSERASE